MLEAVLGVLQAGLSIWASKEKTKYQDKLIDLKKRYYEEYNKPLSDRSDAILDDIWLDLRILCDSFIAQSGKPDAKT